MEPASSGRLEASEGRVWRKPVGHGGPLIIDVGGEGRHPLAWNVNPSPVKTAGPERGAPIPRHVPGRADALPFADQSIDCLIMEKTPLTAAALREIQRVMRRRSVVLLRHAGIPHFDPHILARRLLLGRVRQRPRRLGRILVLETRFVRLA